MFQYKVNFLTASIICQSLSQSVVTLNVLFYLSAAIPLLKKNVGTIIFYIVIHNTFIDFCILYIALHTILQNMKKNIQASTCHSTSYHGNMQSAYLC